MKTGDLVKVVKQIDLHIYGGDWEEAKKFKSFLHKTGRIVGFNNTQCGATPNDPMIVVEFRGKKKDAFWSEELELVCG